MDSDEDNDFTTYSHAAVDGQAFLHVFTDCPDAIFSDVSPAPMKPVCQRLITAPIPPNARVDTDSYVKMCNNAESDKLRCSILQSFALATYNNFQDIFSGMEICDNLRCQRHKVDVCDTNCKDHLYQACESEVIFDCACSTGLYLTQNGSCVNREDCGCYDFTQPDAHFESGEESRHGCRN
ncbi:hypothetical protein PoB_007072300, partial [Plakobranchus ocellatus]